MAWGQRQTITTLFALMLCLNVLTWLALRDTKTAWQNIPPVPSYSAATAFGLGDNQFAYRTLGVMLQNFGDVGGRSTAFSEYSYEELTRWLYLMDYLDPKSNFIPHLATYYFGAAPNGEQLRPLMDYFLHIGPRIYGEKWRYLAHGVYLARYEMEDMDRALEMANALAAIENDEMPAFTRQMGAFIMTVQGKKEAAYSLMVELLKDGANTMQRAELNSIRIYICSRILSEVEAAADPLCDGVSAY